MDAKRMKRLLAILNKTEETLAAILIAVMAAVVALQVFNRYFLGASVTWSGELARYLMIWAVFLGSAYATREDRHLSITIVQNNAPNWIRKPVLVLSTFATVVFCGFCVVWGIWMVQHVAGTGEGAPALNIPIYWLYLALPLGMLLMGFRALITVFHLIVKGDNEKNDPTHQFTNRGS